MSFDTCFAGETGGSYYYSKVAFTTVRRSGMSVMQVRFIYNLQMQGCKFVGKLLSDYIFYRHNSPL